ncbi:MAG TPA: histidine kinase [Chitinophagaceae bacterium]|nr:histidine kinase [Chitinophagaceae bacterium]
MQQVVSFFLNNRVTSHIIFWGCIFICTFFLWHGMSQPLTALKLTSWQVSVKILIVYLNFYWLMPKYLYTKRYISYAVGLLFVFALGVLLYRLQWEVLFTRKGGYPFWNPIGWSMDALNIISPVIMFSGGIKLLKNWYIDREKKAAMEKQKLATELNYLKGQIHPHFFFNTLNNLYALTLQKSDDAPTTVLKLSQMMHYMLYDAATEVVPLSKEIKNIQNYIELERIRYSDRLDLSFSVTGPIDGKEIAPLILLPFVENAFKHGTSNEHRECWITIDLKVKDNMLLFKVENSVNSSNKSTNFMGYKSGIGLKNVRRRLELLYPSQHQLNIVKEPEAHWVDLKLELQHTYRYEKDQVPAY